MADLELDEHAQGVAAALQLLMADMQDHEKRALIYAALPDSFIILIKSENITVPGDTGRQQVTRRLQGASTILTAMIRELDGSTPFGRAAQEVMRRNLDEIRTNVGAIGRILGLRT